MYHQDSLPSRLARLALLLAIPASAAAADGDVVSPSIVDKPRLLIRDARATRALAFSPDGKLLASDHGRGKVALWDVATGKRRLVLGGTDAEQVVSLVFTPDGKALGVLSRTGRFRLWDVKTGKKLLAVYRSCDRVSMAFSPDGKAAALGQLGETIVVDLATGKTRERYKDPGKGQVRTVAFTRDGKQMLTGTLDGRWNLFDVASGKTLSDGKVEGPVFACTFSPSGHPLIASYSEGRAVVTHPLGRRITKFTVGRRFYDVEQMVFSPSRGALAVATAMSGDRYEPVGVIELWELGQLDPRLFLRTRGPAATAAAFAPDGQTVAATDKDGSIQIWDVPRIDYSYHFPPGFQGNVLRGHTATVHAVVYSPDGRTLASAAGDDTVRLWDAAAGDLRLTLRGHSGEVRALAYSPDGKCLASGGTDKRVKLWDPATGKQRASWGGFGGVVLSLAYSPDGKTLAVAASDGSVHLWDVRKGKEQAVLEAHKGPAYAAAFGADGKALYTAGGDGFVRLWDPASGNDPARLAQGAPVRSVALNRKGTVLAAADSEGRIVLWDVKALRRLGEPFGTTDLVWDLAFTPDGKVLAAACLGKGGVELWDTASPTRPFLLRHLVLPDGSARCVAFTPNGKTLAAGGSGREIWQWPLERAK